MYATWLLITICGPALLLATVAAGVFAQVSQLDVFDIARAFSAVR